MPSDLNVNWTSIENDFPEIPIFMSGTSDSRPSEAYIDHALRSRLENELRRLESRRRVAREDVSYNYPVITSGTGGMCSYERVGFIDPFTPSKPTDLLGFFDRTVSELKLKFKVLDQRKYFYDIEQLKTRWTLRFNDMQYPIEIIESKFNEDLKELNSRQSRKRINTFFKN